MKYQCWVSILSSVRKISDPWVTPANSEKVDDEIASITNTKICEKTLKQFAFVWR